MGWLRALFCLVHRPSTTLCRKPASPNICLQVLQLPTSPKVLFSSYKHNAGFFTGCSSVPISHDLPGVLFLLCQAWPSAFATSPPLPASPSLSSSLFFESFLALHQLLPLPSSQHDAGVGEMGRRIEHQRKSAVGVWGLWFGIGLSGK